MGKLVGMDPWNLELIARKQRPAVFTHRQLQRFCSVFDLTYEELIHKDLSV